MPRLGQRIGQVPRRLCRPDQQRHRVPASLRIHESRELQQQSWIRLRQALPPATGCPHPDRRLRLARQPTKPTGDRVRVHASSRRDDLDPTPAELLRLGPQKQSTLPLIQMWPQHQRWIGELFAKGIKAILDKLGLTEEQAAMVPKVIEATVLELSAGN